VQRFHPPRRRGDTRSGAERATDYRKLAKDPPCLRCEMKESDHVNGKCLFTAGMFQDPPHFMLRIFFRRGTYKHD
jgi:hypothetical protein